VGLPIRHTDQSNDLERLVRTIEEHVPSLLRIDWPGVGIVSDQVRPRVAAQGPTQVGNPVETLDDPFALEVHRPIVVAGREDLPPLPPYLHRDHDRALRERVEVAVAERNSTMIVLVGGSSSGKTRACSEVLRIGRDAGEGAGARRVARLASL